MNKYFLLLLSVTLLGLTSCGHHDDKDHQHSHDEEEGEHHHDESEEGQGISYDHEKGLSVNDETQKAIGLETQLVKKQTLAPVVSIPFQIYRESSEESLSLSGFKTGFAYATAYVNASSLIKKDSVGLVVVNETSLKANVFKLDNQTQSYTGQVEVLVQIEDPQHLLRVGQSVEIQMSLSEQSDVMTLPQSAVLKTATEGSIVYLKKENAFKRIKVETGLETSDQVLIKEGLQEGDEVVVKGIKSLWLSELKAVKGGGHSH